MPCHKIGLIWICLLAFWPWAATTYYGLASCCNPSAAKNWFTWNKPAPSGTRQSFFETQRPLFRLRLKGVSHQNELSSCFTKSHDECPCSHPGDLKYLSTWREVEPLGGDLHLSLDLNRCRYGKSLASWMKSSCQQTPTGNLRTSMTLSLQTSMSESQNVKKYCIYFEWMDSNNP